MVQKKASVANQTVVGGMSDEHYRARQDMHTLKEHAEIKSDPKRHAAAVAAAKVEQACLAKIDKRVKK